MFLKNVSSAIIATACLSLSGCFNDSNPSNNDKTISKNGEWLKGDLHVHTAISADAREPLSNILKQSFDTFSLDYVSLSNHMRDSSQDNDDNDIGGILYYDALVGHELPGVAELKSDLYKDKIILSTFEWDMPTHEHFNIGIFSDGENSPKSLEAIKTFEYLFSYKNDIEDFSSKDIEEWNKQGLVRKNKTHQDGVAALEWLQRNFPTTSYGMLNHPRRYLSSYTIEDIRTLNNAAPDVFFLVEGMVGGQFSGNRGDYGSSSSGVFGGVDPFVAELGGWWDALLGEGRKIWNVSNSDIHFKTREPYSSSYFPGEYAKSYTFIKEKDSKGILEGLRSGKSFSVFGDLINVLDFNVKTTKSIKGMGETLMVNPGDTVKLTIRFKSPDINNKEDLIGDENYNGINLGLHHIDLISGNIKEKALPGSDQYSIEKNTSTSVIKSFTEKEWTVDDEGFNSISYSFVASTDQYFRLRGTNLDYNVEGLTENGNPLKSDVYDQSDYTEISDYYNKINKRNYDDLWFYSNPIFINVK